MSKFVCNLLLCICRFFDGYSIEAENALPKYKLGKAFEYAQNLLPNVYFILED